MMIVLLGMCSTLAACKPEGARKTPAPTARAASQSVHRAYARLLPGCAVTLGIENYWSGRLQAGHGEAEMEDALSAIAASKPACLTGAHVPMASQTLAENSVSTKDQADAPPGSYWSDVPCPGELIGVSPRGYLCRSRDESPSSGQVVVNRPEPPTDDVDQAPVPPTSRVSGVR